jgi:hypothetical protein
MAEGVPKTKNSKPLGGKSYGSIAHLPGSRLGLGDHHCHEGQARIATVKTRDKHDFVIVQEKLDGSNTGIARIDGTILALTRAGYEAHTSPFVQHYRFADWVKANEGRFLELLREGERVCGEWLAQAHGTRYQLPHEPFVAFDLFREGKRITHTELVERAQPSGFTTPFVVHAGHSAFPMAEAEAFLQTQGKHGALDPLEGLVWRVERQGVVDFLCKYVRPDKIDGKYLPEINGTGETVWNVSTGD